MDEWRGCVLTLFTEYCRDAANYGAAKEAATEARAIMQKETHTEFKVLKQLDDFLGALKRRGVGEVSRREVGDALQGQRTYVMLAYNTCCRRSLRPMQMAKLETKNIFMDG